jgi:AcrR family transcriptional regulator
MNPHSHIPNSRSEYRKGLSMITATRRRRAMERTREDILEAAARAFTRRGYASATMRDIAQEAGYTAASLYTYFKSKDEILQGLISRVIDDFQQVFDAPVPAGLSFAQKIELLLGRQLAVAERQRDLFQMFLALGVVSECIPRNKSGRPDPFWPIEVQIKRFAEWIREHATERELGGRAPEDVARFMVSVAHGFLHDWMARGGSSGELTRLLGLILDFYFHGVSSKRAGAPSKPGGAKE